jgi:hypothetical protein
MLVEQDGGFLMRSWFIAAAVLGMMSQAYAEDLCFGREYSASHLAKHPQQLVTGMLVRIYDEPTYTPPMGWALKVTRRGDRRPLLQMGNCRRLELGMKDDLHCFADCDAGEFNVKFEGRNSLLLKLPRDMSMRQDCGGEENDSVLSPGLDDKVFRLERLPSSSCADIER